MPNKYIFIIYILTNLIDTFQKTICINTQKKTPPKEGVFCLQAYIIVYRLIQSYLVLYSYFSITDSSSCVPSGKKAFTINLFGITVIVI